MSINIALIADPHLCVQARRRNIQSLLSRKLWSKIDVSDREKAYGVSRYFSITKPTSFDDEPLLAAADFLEEVSREMDLLVVLGDLATTGTSEDLEVARQVFLDPLVKEHVSAGGDPRIGGLGIPLHVVPGNHDRYKDDVATPGSTEFDRVFDAVYKSNKGVCVKELHKADISMCVISADFCFAEGISVGYLRRLGRGAVDDVILNELDFQTRTWQRKNPEKPVIWALHFSPADGVPTALVLEEREKVTDLARFLGVNHIFCGHTHMRKREIGAYPHIYCAGSVSSIDSYGNHFLHTCTVSKADNGTLQLEVFDLKYDENMEEFVSYPIPLTA